MNKVFRCDVSVLKWSEQSLIEINKQKSTHAHVHYRYRGDIQGEGKADFLMQYHADGSADFVALETLKGRLPDGTDCILRLRHQGTHNAEGAKGHCDVWSDEGALAGHSGSALYQATTSEFEMHITVSHSL